MFKKGYTKGSNDVLRSEDAPRDAGGNPVPLPRRRHWGHHRDKSIGIKSTIFISKSLLGVFGDTGPSGRALAVTIRCATTI
eukprot:7404085-Heterocapsa_arctica.AAC.1